MRGLNAMISAILLIAIVVLVSSIILNWATSLTKGQTKSISNRTGECTASDITVQDVYLDINSTKGRMSVRNSGFSDEDIISAVIISRSGEQATIWNASLLPMAISKGALVNLEINLTGKITACANFSQAIVSTRCATDKFTSTPKCS